MAASELVVLVQGRIAGTLVRSRTGALSFSYDDGYQGPPLSLSIPIENREFPQRVVLPYLLGLLPDSEDVRRTLGREHGVGPDNAFELLRHIGLDCPGAVQFCQPDRLDQALVRPELYVPLTDSQIAARLRDLGANAPASWQQEREHWSLGGSQGKFALAWHHRTWCSCREAAPTTHIFKNGVNGYALQALNEFYCMRLARACGLTVAEVTYRLFDGEPCIIISRYDRIPSADGTILRLHQEDLCQALSVVPSKKYTMDGGPGTPQIAKVLRSTNSPGLNLRLFTEELFFNCLVGATDAHAKNYSLLLNSQGGALLAPLYDVASALPYEGMRQRARLAMSIGGENRLGRMSRGAIARYVTSGQLEDVGLGTTECTAMMDELAGRVLDQEGSLFESLGDLPGMQELRAHLEGPLVESVTSIRSSLRA